MPANPQPGPALGRPRSVSADVLVMLPMRLLMLVGGVIISALIARELGPSGRGAVAVAFGLSLLLTQFGTLGVTSANPYFVAREPGLRARLVANSLVFAAVVGTAMAAVGAGVRLIAPQAVEGVSWGDLSIALAAIPAALLGQFLQSIMLGEGRVRAFYAIEVAVTALMLAVLVAIMTTSQLSVRGALVLLVGGRVLVAAMFLAMMSRGCARLRTDRSLARRMAGYGLRVYAATLLAYLVIRIDLLLVNAYEGPEQAGYYATAVALADALYILPGLVALNLFAHVARGTDDETSARIFRSVSVIYFVVCALTAVGANLIIQFVYGKEFAQAAALFWWLAPGIFCLGMLNILSQHFAGRGFPLQAVLVWVLGLALNIAMNVVLLPIAGTEMAALSSTVTYIVLLVLHMRMFAGSVGGYEVLRPRLGEVATLLRASVGRTRTAPVA